MRFGPDETDVVTVDCETGTFSITNLRQGEYTLRVNATADNGIAEYGLLERVESISAGDTRILLINGEPVPVGLARVPSAGETRGNLAAGGSGVPRPLTDRDRWICAQIGPELKAKGLVFVGIDVIGDYLTEINVTSPTGIQEINRFDDVSLESQLWGAIEERRSRSGDEE